MLCIGLYPRLTEQAGEKRNKDKPNRCNAAARHELLHTLAFGTGIVITIALQEVDNTPNTQARAKSDNKGLQYINCAIEKIHKLASLSAALRLSKNCLILFLCMKKTAVFYSAAARANARKDYEVVE